MDPGGAQRIARATEELNLGCGYVGLAKQVPYLLYYFSGSLKLFKTLCSKFYNSLNNLHKFLSYFYLFNYYQT